MDKQGYIQLDRLEMRAANSEYKIDLILQKLGIELEQPQGQKVKNKKVE